uniref:Olfactory receptor n=1 Tax=Anabas testudineus TaxID=64144 RepID=A0A3Q1IRK9_ANATE
MEEELNTTYLILGGHMELQKYRYLCFVFVFIMYILILCSNSTIVYLIWKHQDLHEPMYIFIAALLVNSILFTTNIYPKLLIDFLSEKQIISYQDCLVQYYMLYSLGGSEFLLLTAMAYDRYVSICKPLQYPTIMRKRTVSIFLTLAWLLPACQFVGLTIMSSNQKLCSFTLKNLKARSVFGVVALIITVPLPVLFILFTYTRILIISFRSRRNVRRKAAQTCLPHLLVLISFTCLGAFDVIIVRLGSDFPKTVHFTITLQTILCHPLFNPIIYGLKMKEISKHLKKLYLSKKDQGVQDGRCECQSFEE